MRCKSSFILVFVMFLIGLASASFEFSNEGSFIIDKYQPSDSLKIDINISFLNQSLNSNLSDSFGNSIYLSELLQQNSEYHTIFFDISNTSISSAFQILSFNWTEFEAPSSERNLNYILRLNQEKVFEKEFRIVSSENAIEDMLETKKSQLNSSKSKISTFEEDVQSLLNSFINTNKIESELKYYEENYETMTIEEQEEILTNISSIKIPQDIYQKSYTTSMPFYPKREIINLDILAEINGEGFTGNYDEYLDAVFLWNNENLKTNVLFREIEIEYGPEEKDTLNIFLFTFDRIGSTEEAYILIRDTNDISFEDLSLPIQTYNGYLYLRLSEVYGTMGLMTEQNLDFVDFPLFVSPPFENLTPVKVGEYERWEAQKKWLLFGLILFLVLFIGAVIYSLLQIWYRKRYETYLFKTKNNMYNIMVYIHNSKVKGTPREDIEKNLKKAGWTKEQIGYALQKYEGKKIAGMIHNPMNIGSQEPKKEIRKNPVRR